MWYCGCVVNVGVSLSDYLFEAACCEVRVRVRCFSQ